MISSHKAEITFFEVILGRRSVRHYQAKRVGKISISSLLEAAVRAPTAMHQEPWAFVIINDKGEDFYAQLAENFLQISR